MSAQASVPDRPRVLVAGLFHETHTFLPETTPLEAFQVRVGQELLEAQGDGSPLGAALEEGSRLGWQWVPAVDLRATPSGTVQDDVLEFCWQQLRRTVQHAGPLDGVLLVLHGAMACQNTPDVEGELLLRLRSLAGVEKLPLVGVLDLHANHSPEMARGATALVAYRHNPHTDAAETGVRAVELLQRIFRTGRKPCYLWQPAPVVWPPTGTGTDDEPMRTLAQMARQMEVDGSNVAVVNVLGGYSFADTPWTGVSFSAAVFGSVEPARQQLRRLAQTALDQRRQGYRVPSALEEVIGQILATPGRPVLIVEPSDNIGGGAPGNSTAVVQALLRHGVTDLAAVINDPQAVARCWNYPPGEPFHVRLGPEPGPFSAGPLELDVELVHRSRGRFRLEDAHSHLASMAGLEVDMGPCVTLRHRDVWLLVTSRKTPPFDLGQLRSQGIEPTQRRFVVVKAAVAHRRAYDPIAAASFTVDTPGPCSSRLDRFPYRRLRRPVFPLDEPQQLEPGYPDREEAQGL